MSFIGIDLGTTFIKGAVLDLETRTLRHVMRRPFPAQVENAPPLACEFDPDEILSAVRALLDEIAPHCPDCEGLVMCAQMHGMVLMNSRGEVKSNCVTWRDQRVVMPASLRSGIRITRSCHTASSPSSSASLDTNSTPAARSAIFSGLPSKAISPRESFPFHCRISCSVPFANPSPEWS